MDVTIDGRPRKIVAQPTKQGWLYTFDRITGQPIWPIPGEAVRRRTCRRKNVADRSRSRQSPSRTRAPTVSTDDVIDFTPALRAQALENLKRIAGSRRRSCRRIRRSGPSLPRCASTSATPGAACNWPGSGFDPETASSTRRRATPGVTYASFDKEEIDLIGPEYQSKNRIPWWESPYGRSGRPGGAERGWRSAVRHRQRGAAAWRARAAAAGRRRGGPCGGRRRSPCVARRRRRRPAAGAQAGCWWWRCGRGGATQGLEGLPNRESHPTA
jgi:hypothetical protein